MSDEQLELPFEQSEPETIESLTEALQGTMDVVASHGIALAHIIRVLEDEGIRVMPVFKHNQSIH